MMSVRIVRIWIGINNITNCPAMNMEQLTFFNKFSHSFPFLFSFQVVVDGNKNVRANVLRQSFHSFIDRHIYNRSNKLWMQGERNVIVIIEHGA